MNKKKDKEPKGFSIIKPTLIKYLKNVYLKNQNEAF